MKDRRYVANMEEERSENGEQRFPIADASTEVEIVGAIFLMTRRTHNWKRRREETEDNRRDMGDGKDEQIYKEGNNRR